MDWRSRFKIPVKTQRRPWLVHHRITVRKLLLIGGSTILLLLILAVSGVGERIGDKVVFYVRVARLYGETPDSTLAMPLQDVAKKQVADTWHAPRGTDRVHEGQDIFAPKGTPIYSATEGYVYNVGENRLGQRGDEGALDIENACRWDVLSLPVLPVHRPVRLDEDMRVDRG